MGLWCSTNNSACRETRPTLFSLIQPVLATRTSKALDSRGKPLLSFWTGAAIGVLGGLIGLGGAEFRLPLLLTVFGYTTLPAVVVNLVVSLVTVVFSFIFRLSTIGLEVIASDLSV